MDIGPLCGVAKKKNDDMCEYTRQILYYARRFLF